MSHYRDPFENKPDSLTRSKLPRLSIGERDRRWAAVRSAMKREEIECLLVHGDSGKWDQKFSNIHYLSQIGGNGEDGWLAFPVRDEPSAFIFSGGSMLKMWGERQDWVSDLRTVPGNHWSGALTIYLKEAGLSKAKLGVVGLSGYQESEGTVSYTTLTKLKEQLPEAEFCDASYLLENLRLFKSEEEIRFIEKAAEIGDHAAKIMRELAKPGVSEIIVYARILEALIEAGSEQPITFFWDAGPVVSHAQRYPGRVVLEKGDVILTEISPRFYGYWAHCQISAAVGGPTPEYRELFEVAYASYMNTLNILRPGIKIRDLAAAFEAPIKEAGMTSLHPYAHGTGGRGTEFPVIFTPASRAKMTPEGLVGFEKVMDMEIGEGMVLAFEPHVTKDMVHGLHIGDTVLVTEHGSRRLSRLDLRDWLTM